MTDLVFIDTETLGLDPQAPIWEFAAIRVRPGLPVETREFTITHFPAYWLESMAASSPKGAELADDYRNRYNPAHALTEADAAREIHAITKGAQVIGCNPGFDIDSQRLTALLQRNGIEPAWHYHPIDISSKAMGWLAAAGRLPAPPWSSDQLSALIGVDPTKFARHTAMGDCRWVQAQYDKLMRPALRLESLPAAAVAGIDGIAAAIEATIRATFKTIGESIGVDMDPDHFAVVRLPEPAGRWAEGPEWVQGGLVRDRSGWVTWTSPGALVMLQRIEPGELTPDQARELGAALLAAANAADGADGARV